jgi:hypothetical protein
LAHKTNQQIVKFVGKLQETDWLKFTHRTKRVVFLLSLSRSNKKNHFVLCTLGHKKSFMFAGSAIFHPSPAFQKKKAISRNFFSSRKGQCNPKKQKRVQKYVIDHQSQFA